MADDVTRLLVRWRTGDQEALATLLPLVHDELRRMARRALSGERPNRTLQPTALVNEAFLRLVPQQQKDWQNRGHFFAVCAQIMRQVLVDQARRRNAKKRGPEGLRVELDEAKVESPSGPTNDVDVIDLSRALDELTAIDQRRCRVVEMRYFAGMTIPEIASVLDIDDWEVKKDWMLAKAWLRRRLKEPR